MRKIRLGSNDDDLAITEIAEMEKLLAGEAVFEQQEEQEEYTDLNIITFTFEDGMVPRKDERVATPRQFETAFLGNERLFTSKNQDGYHVYVATSRDDLHELGYIIMNTAEFIQENPDGLYDIWCELLDEVKTT
jgi:hypothetical protein